MRSNTALLLTTAIAVFPGLSEVAPAEDTATEQTVWVMKQGFPKITPEPNRIRETSGYEKTLANGSASLHVWEKAERTGSKMVEDLTFKFGWSVPPARGTPRQTFQMTLSASCASAAERGGRMWLGCAWIGFDGTANGKPVENFEVLVGTKNQGFEPTGSKTVTLSFPENANELRLAVWASDGGNGGTGKVEYAYDRVARDPKRPEGEPAVTPKTGDETGTGEKKPDLGEILRGLSKDDEKPALLKAEFSNGDTLELVPGEVSKIDGILVSNYRGNTEDRVEVVFPQQTDLWGSLPGGIVVAPGTTSQWPAIMARPKAYFSEMFSARSTAAPGTYQIVVMVRQRLAGEVRLLLTVKVLNKAAPGGAPAGVAAAQGGRAGSPSQNPPRPSSATGSQAQSPPVQPAQPPKDIGEILRALPPLPLDPAGRPLSPPPVASPEGQLLAMQAQKQWADGDLAGAEQSLRQAIRAEPSHPGYKLTLGSLYISQGKAAEAEDLFRKALAVEPQNAILHGGLAETFAARSKWAEAERANREAARLDPINGTYWWRLGVDLGNQGKWPDAEACFREAVRLNPNSSHAHHGVASSLYSQQQYANAEKEYREAKRLEPQNGLFCADLAGALFAQGKPDEALEEAKQALRLGHRDHWVYEKLDLKK